MPHPITYVSGQDDDQTRSIDNVHIEPSIREGLHLVSSLYGKDASAPLFRFEPTNSVAPTISGNTQIPSLLACNTGQWSASPAANFDFQWLSDGEEIPGATSKTWLSELEYDLTTITCRVRGWNYLGEVFVVSSNSINISLVEPVILNDLDFSAITGLNLPSKLITYNETTVIASGIGADNRMDVNRGVFYTTTGLAGNQREDINAMSIHVITGIQQEKGITIHQQDSISAISYPQQQPLVEGVPQNINLKNGNADIGLTGWTVVGSARWQWDDDHDYEGAVFFEGGAGVSVGTGNIPYTSVSQNVQMYEIWEDDIDSGSCFLEWFWYQSSLNQSDFANVKIQFLDASLASLGTADPQGLWAGPPENYWVRVEHEAAIPANTRYVKVIMEFVISVGSDANGRIDFVNARIRKGAKPVFTDIPTSSPFWRINFTQARTYPGCSLSELEFRNGIGGADLATGGSVVFGSASNGGTAAAAFDDLRDGNYWSGEESGVANGTSWIGYNFPSDVRPREIDITLRPNNGALELGRDFVIQNSEDGNLWSNVQFIRDIPDPLPLPSQQQLQFEVMPLGAFSSARSFISSADYFRNNLSGDDVASKGVIFRSNVRMEITHLIWHNTFSTQAWDAVLRIGKATFQNGFWHTETIHEVVNQPMTASISSTWREVALTTPMEVDVYSFFYIIVTDLQAASNSQDADEGRVLYLENVVTTRGYSWFEQPTHTRWWYYHKNDTLITQGDPSSSSILGRLDYAVDFRGNII